VIGSDLNPGAWARAQEVFLAVAEEPPEHRLSSARRLCGDSPEIFNAVQRLLAGHEKENGLLDPPLESRSLLPRVLGAWRLVEEIGRGGMSTVYRAERADGQFEKQVAIKLLADEILTPRAIERFRKERQILAGLEHPYTARLLDGGLDSEGCPYIVMEYVDGVPVDRYCRERALTARQTIALAIKICSAVAHAHAHGIVHRDIKPGNLLVTADGTPKLLDFGISRMLDQAGSDGAAGEERTRALTPQYASPEQLAGKPATPASDVYSLGTLLRDLLAGQSAASRWISRDLEAIIAKATGLDPAARYPSAKELRADLERYLAGSPVGAASSRLMSRLVRSLVRCRWQAAVSLLVVFCIVAAILVRRQAKADAARKVQSVKALQALFWNTEARVATLPGSRESRRQLIQQAAAQLEPLGRDAGDDPDLSYELAIAYSMVAYAQGSGAYSVGDYADSAHAYERAIAWGERAVRRGGTARATQLLAGVLASASHNQLWNSEFGSALKLAMQGRSVLEHSPAVVVPLDAQAMDNRLIDLMESQGEALEALGRIDESRDVWRQADALADRIPPARSPGHIRGAIRIMLALSNCAAGNSAAGTTYAESAVRYAETAARLNPVMSTGMLLKAKRALAECELAAGRTREARESLAAIRSRYLELIRTGSPSARTGLADADRLMGVALVRMGELRTATAVYRDGFEVLSSTPDFASTRLAESNRAELLAGRGRLEQAQASASVASSRAAKQYWRAACADYRMADATLREAATNRGLFLSARLAMFAVEKELPKCPDPRGFGSAVSR
jgi:serine/threonine protein kinase